MIFTYSLYFSNHCMLPPNTYLLRNKASTTPRDSCNFLYYTAVMVTKSRGLVTTWLESVANSNYTFLSFGFGFSAMTALGWCLQGWSKELIFPYALHLSPFTMPFYLNRTIKSFFVSRDTFHVAGDSYRSYTDRTSRKWPAYRIDCGVTQLWKMFSSVPMVRHAF